MTTQTKTRPTPAHPQGREACWKIYHLMADGHWRTPFEIAEATQVGILQITARLRDLRHPPYGNNTLLTQVRAGSKGTTEYRLITYITQNPN